MASTTASTTANRRDEVERVQARRLWWAGPLTALAATIGTVLVREIAVLAGAIPANLEILQELPVAISTIAFVLVGTLVFAGIIRFAQRPVRTFRVVALVALALSLLNPMAAGAGWMPLGVTLGAEAVAAMLVMHVVAAAITITLLPALARGR